MFKTTYTKEESKELLRWIDTHPTGEMDLGDGIYIKDINFFVNQMRAIVELSYQNPAFAGQMELLCRLKEAYEKREQNA